MPPLNCMLLRGWLIEPPNLKRAWKVGLRGGLVNLVNPIKLLPLQVYVSGLNAFGLIRGLRCDHWVANGLRRDIYVDMKKSSLFRLIHSSLGSLQNVRMTCRLWP